MGAFLDHRLPIRFWSKCIPEPNSGCWLWTGAIKTVTGYGYIWTDKRVASAHRAAYESLVGPIPDGLQIDHRCRIRCCVNPAHLEPVTNVENQRRGLRGELTTHCPAGHEY